jgi:RNA-directed DNA polymerase
MADTPRVWQELDKWMRHRVRAIQLKQWKRGETTYRKLRGLGASSDVAARAAANTRRWWRNSGKILNTVLDMKWANQLGIPRLC